MRFVYCLALALLSPVTASAETLWVHPVQTSYLARCELCTPAEVNVANPLVVLAPPATETVIFLAFDLPARPKGLDLSSAVLSVTPTINVDYTNTWLPEVTLNATDGLVDLGSLLGPDLPAPETPPAPSVSDGERDGGI